MMPEPPPLDRKGLFKERRHERGQSFDALAAAGTGGGSSTPRWRDPYRPYRRPPPSYHQIYEGSPSERRYGGRSGGGGGRGVNRESRGGSFRRSPFRDSTPHVTYQRSVAVPIYSPPPLKDLVNDKNGGNDQRPQRDRDQDNSLGSIAWKPSMWSRQGSFNSSARSETEVPAPNLGKESSVGSLAGSPARADDELPRKKPRLGWGQGLAKYEKQKVEGAANSGKDHVTVTSPKIVGVAGSTSPATPCSAARSSPGMDGPFSEATSVENGKIHLSHPPPLGPKSRLEELSINTDHLPPISTLNWLLNDLLQTEDACFGDSTFTTNAALDRLLLFKVDIAKELETTEYEIDLFDNELQSLKADQESVQRQISYITQNDSDPISCLVSPEGSLKMSLNFTPGLSLTIRGTKEPVLESSSPHKPDMQFKNADDSIPQLLKSKIVESESLGKGIPCISTMDSTGCAANVDDIFEVQHSTANDVVERITNENDLRDAQTFDASTSAAGYTGGGSSHGRDSNDLLASIMASNKDAAELASQVFDKSLLSIVRRFDPWESGQILSCRKNDLHVKEKLALHKYQLKIKERVLTLKFRALHRLWKEDLRLLFVKKQELKSQKHFRLHNQSSQSGSQKHRSIQSRYTLPAGNMMLVPTADIVNFTCKLLSDSHIKMFRSNLKMPALISDEKERSCSRFITKNGLLEDPLSFEKERTMINPWTQEERRVFMEMLATFGKDFGKISSFLNHKTTADCIEFYYKNHKSDSFKDVKKQLDSRKQRQCLPTNNYMVTTGKQRNQEANAASLDMLGAASVIAAHKKGHTRNQQKHAGRTDLPSYHSPKLSRASYGFLERVNGGEISAALDKETTAAGVLAGICGALSSEAVSSCVTGSVNCVMSDRPLTPYLTQFVEEDDTCSDEGCEELLHSVDWTDEEKSEFIRALRMYGKDFANISHHVGTKSRDQCRIFFSKARKCLGLDMIQPAAGNVETPVSDANGGRSDMNDACAAELGSGICSTQSCSKMDVVNSSCEGFVHAGNSSSQTDALRGSNKDEHDRKSALKVEKLKTEDTNLQVSSIPEEVDDNSLSCNSEEFSEDAKSTGVVKVRVRSPVEQIMTCTKNEQWKPQLSVDIQQKDATVRRSPADVRKVEVDLRQQVLLSGDRCRKNDIEQRNSVNLPAAEVSDSNTAVSKTNDFQQLKPPLESISCLQKKPRFASLHDPSSVYSEGSIRVNSPSTTNFEGHRNKIRKVSAAEDFSKQPLLGNQSVKQIDDVLSGYPMQVSSVKEMAKISEKSVNEKCSGSAVSSSRSVMLPAACEFRPCLQNACEEGEEQSTRVKLFGQILSNPSPSQKSSSSPVESEVRTRIPKIKKSASEEEFASALPSTHVPRRSYRFRDGNEIQTRFSSLPESQSSDGVSNANNVLSVNGKQLPELQKRNGFEVASGFRRQGRKVMARLGVNEAGGAGASDAVAAILAATGRAPLLLDGETEQLRTDLGGR